jgi:hypothetical protein
MLEQRNRDSAYFPLFHREGKLDSEDSGAGIRFFWSFLEQQLLRFDENYPCVKHAYPG